MNQTTTAASTTSPKKKCDCGCGSSTAGCDLECLVQPRFFCGQLLADQDLTALVDWVKSKTALARFRHGWGVVCGLDVHCGKDGTVTISPGYAMDCCGRDIVVCEESPLDLSECWTRCEDPCADVKKKPVEPTGVRDFGGFRIKEAELQAVDVFIRYSESLSDSRPALARGSCSSAAGCESTRVREGHELYCRRVLDPCAEPDDPRAGRDVAYEQDRNRMLAELAKAKNSFATLRDYVRRNPPRTFCFIQEWLCALEGKGEPAAATLNTIARWLQQDWRNARLAQPCGSCRPDEGIRLARVWIWGRRDGSKTTYTSVYINSAPPYSRPLKNDDHAGVANGNDWTQYVWQPVSSVIPMLTERRHKVMVQPYVDTDVGEERDPIRREWRFAPFTTNVEVTLYWSADPCDGRRIVCIAPAAQEAGGGDFVPVEGGPGRPFEPGPVRPPDGGLTPADPVPVTPIPGPGRTDPIPVEQPIPRPIRPLPDFDPVIDPGLGRTDPIPVIDPVIGRPEPVPNRPIPILDPGLGRTDPIAVDPVVGRPEPAPVVDPVILRAEPRDPVRADEPIRAELPRIGRSFQPGIPLVDIDGIGDAIANRLQAAGIRDVAALAEASPAEVARTLSSLRVNEARAAQLIRLAQKKLKRPGRR